MQSSWKAPAPGDLVWCHSPELPELEPGPKPRPALILSVAVHEDGIAVLVVYGTSKRVQHLKVGEFAISRAKTPDAYKLASLAYDTKFDFKVTVQLPWTAAFFKVPPQPRYGQTPKLGTLHPSLMRAAKAAHGAAASR